MQLISLRFKETKDKNFKGTSDQGKQRDRLYQAFINKQLGNVKIVTGGATTFAIFEKEILNGGKGDNIKPEDVNQNELKVGIYVEMEHTDNKKIATEIAIDHLSEVDDYYTILIKSGLVDEPKALELAKKLLNIE